MKGNASVILMLVVICVLLIIILLAVYGTRFDVITGVLK